MSISLTPTERAFLEGSRQFTNAQKRYIRYRINKKLKYYNMDLEALQRLSVIAATVKELAWLGYRRSLGEG